MLIDKFENRYYRRHPSWRPSRILLKDAGNDDAGGGSGSNSGSNTTGSGTGNGNNQDGKTPPDTKGGSSGDDDGQSSDDNDDGDDDDENVELTPAQQRMLDKKVEARLARERAKQERAQKRAEATAEQERLRNEKKWEELVKTQTAELEDLRPKAEALERLEATLSTKLDAEIARWPKSIRAAFREDLPFADKFKLAEDLREAATALITGQKQQQGDQGDQGSQQQSNGRDGANHKDPPAHSEAGKSAAEEAAMKQHAAIYGRGI